MSGKVVRDQTEYDLLVKVYHPEMKNDIYTALPRNRIHEVNPRFDFDKVVYKEEDGRLVKRSEEERDKYAATFFTGRRVPPEWVRLKFRDKKADRLERKEHRRRGRMDYSIAVKLVDPNAKYSVRRKNFFSALRSVTVRPTAVDGAKGKEEAIKVVEGIRDFNCAAEAATATIEVNESVFDGKDDDDKEAIRTKVMEAIEKQCSKHIKVITDFKPSK